MSTSSKPKSRPPAHQNKFAFRHNKNSKLTKVIEQVGTEGLCKRCSDKIEWRKKYRKYKPLSAPRKCNGCDKKNIKAAYRTICTGCAAGERCEGCAVNLKGGAKEDRGKTEEEEDVDVAVDDGVNQEAGEMV